MALEVDDEHFAPDPFDRLRTGHTIAAIILYDNNHILLTKRAVPPFKGYWCLPGGKIEKDESSRQAVVREVKEETGLDVEVLYQTGQYEERGAREGVTYLYYPTCYLVKQIGGAIKKQETEVAEISMVNLSDIPDLAFSHNKMLEDFLMEYYGNYRCPKCNSSQIQSTFKMDGWTSVNSIKSAKFNTCQKCGCSFTKETIVSL